MSPISRQAAASVPLRILDLALPVVAEAPGLKDRPGVRSRRARRRARRARRLRQSARLDAEPGDEIFLGQPVLRDRQDPRVGQDRRARGQKSRGLRRHVLELVGDHIDIGGEAVERRVVGIVGAGDPMHHVESGRIRTGSEHVAFESKPRGREREHAAELAAAQDADRRVGGEHVRPECPDSEVRKPWRHPLSELRNQRDASNCVSLVRVLDVRFLSERAAK